MGGDSGSPAAGAESPPAWTLRPDARPSPPRPVVILNNHGRKDSIQHSFLKRGSPGRQPPTPTGPGSPGFLPFHARDSGFRIPSPLSPRTEGSRMPSASLSGPWSPGPVFPPNTGYSQSQDSGLEAPAQSLRASRIRLSAPHSFGAERASPPASPLPRGFRGADCGPPGPRPRRCASLAVTPRSRRRVPDLGSGPPRVFKTGFWLRPVVDMAPPTVRESPLCA